MSFFPSMQQQFNVNKSHRRHIMTAMVKELEKLQINLIRALAKHKDVARELEVLKRLKPRNIKSEQQWQMFIKEKIFVEFKVRFFFPTNI